MPIAISKDHMEWQQVVREFLDHRKALEAARETLDAGTGPRPDLWNEMAALGWLGLHLPSRLGGGDGSLAELAIVLEEMGRTLAPGAYLPTVITSATIAAAGPVSPLAADLPGLADGGLRAGVGLGGRLHMTPDSELTGDAGVVLGADHADLLLLAVGEDLVLVGRRDGDVTVEKAPDLDPTQRSARVRLHSVRMTPDRILRGARRAALAVSRALAAAQAAGGAAACLDMAVEYAKVREQFGRPIGAFQAVKHHCANMLVDAELGAAVAWDAVHALTEGHTAQADLAAAVAATEALPRFLRNAQLNVQVHGGIGFTWEHDAHMYLRRAAALVALFGGPPAARDVTLLRDAGVVSPSRIALPPEAEAMRPKLRAYASRLAASPPEAQRRELIRSGYAMPQLPPPWGRGADAAEQVVVDQELGHLEHPDYGVGAWVIPTLLQHATPGQRERWLTPSLGLDLLWCQMFSEPDAGSDAAAISTRGARTDGGWLVTGQKVWISRATSCHRGVATVRTSAGERKRDGITMVVIDMAAPGVEVRPLREASDEYGFGEVFLDGVFVPDEDVLGPVDQGWAVARSMLGNERLTVGSISRFGGGAVDLLAVHRQMAGDVPGAAERIGEVLAHGQALRLLDVRSAQRAVMGLPPGTAASITKLVRAEHTQRAAEVALRLLGADAVIADGVGAASAKSIVKSRMTSIGGGTSEIVRTLIADRVLGLPAEKRAR